MRNALDLLCDAVLLMLRVKVIRCPCGEKHLLPLVFWLNPLQDPLSATSVILPDLSPDSLFSAVFRHPPLSLSHALPVVHSALFSVKILLIALLCRDVFFSRQDCRFVGRFGVLFFCYGQEVEKSLQHFCE